MNKILVTGAKGFIGKHLCLKLERLGYTVFKYDVDSSKEDLDKYVSECDFVVHLAGINRPLTPEEFYEGNTNFTKYLIDLIKAKRDAELQVIMSSSTQAALDNDYGKSKKMGEDYLFNSGLPVYVYRLANVFGKWCRPNYNSAAATFCYNIAHNLDITIRDREYVVHYNYVDDIVDEFIRVIKSGSKGSKEILSVKPVYDCSLGKLASLIADFKKTVESDEHLPTLHSPFEVKLFISFLDYLKDDSYSYNYAKDARGSFEELYKNEKYGQISVNKAFPGIVKGGHYHTYKNEIFMTVVGDCVTRLRKIGSKEIVEYRQEASKSVKVYITPYHTHDIKNIGNCDSATLMWISEVYSDKTPDTFREDVDIQ